jgi:hypothetical protein
MLHGPEPTTANGILGCRNDIYLGGWNAEPEAYVSHGSWRLGQGFPVWIINNVFEQKGLVMRFPY